MSRQIDLTKPLSDEDHAYLMERNREYEISLAPKAGEFQDPAVDPEEVPQGIDDESGDDTLDGLDDLEGSQPDGDQGNDELADLTIPELKALLTAKDLPTTGSKQDLIDRLRA